MALISEGIGAQSFITFEKSPSNANETIALLNANILDDSSRGQSHLMVFILGTGMTSLLKRMTSSPNKGSNFGIIDIRVQSPESAA
jgi:hypothetical protein